ncbi:MAG: extracellular solute-binding protein [Spirochaetales bacterium]|nr:extracellular solute-binding protein [Spirochaetales bacterium]
MKKVGIFFLVILLITGISVFVYSGGQKEGGGKKYSGQTIRVLFMSATYAEAARDISKEFQAETGAKVEVVDFPYVTLHEKELLGLTSGAGSYDVISIACQWDGEFSPWLEDLEKYIKRDNWDTSDIMESVWQNSGKWQGKIMGIPHSNTPRLLSYRTDLIKKFPKTWDGFMDIARKLNNPAKGFYAFAIPGQKSQLSGQFFEPLWSLGGRWADENWNVTIDSPETRKALNIVKEEMSLADPAASSWGIPEASAAFLQGNAAFCLAWPTLGVTVDGDNPSKSKVVGKWALADYPYGKTGLTVLSSWDLGIPSNSKHKDAAWDFIKTYTSADNQMRFFKKYTILSPRKSFWETEELKKSKLYPHKEASDRGTNIWWRIPAGTAALGVMRDAISSYATGQWSLDQTVKYMEDGLKKVLKDNPPASGIKNTNR